MVPFTALPGTPDKKKYHESDIGLTSTTGRAVITPVVRQMRWNVAKQNNFPFHLIAAEVTLLLQHAIITRRHLFTYRIFPRPNQKL
jgi:hypothetical protein